MGKNEPERNQDGEDRYGLKRKIKKKTKLYFHVHVMHKPLEILFKHPLFPPTPTHPTPNTNPPDMSSRDIYKINAWAHADIEKFHIYKQSCTVLFII